MGLDATDIFKQDFDYVVIGGGTAGLCLAARLSEDPKISVLVLEAGQSHLADPTINIPGHLGYHINKPEYDWAFTTVPQAHAKERSLLLSRGKGLGGSSGINMMTWNIPPASDIDDWEKLGNPGWNWSEYEKYLARTNGDLKTSIPPTVLSFQNAILEAWEKMGIPPAPDFLSGNPSGTHVTLNTIDPKTITRSYAATAFYGSITERKNLSVLPGAYVQKLDFNTPSAPGADLTARAVQFSYKDSIHEIRATREIVLSAGALKSPHILELSGIGNPQILDKIGIPLKIDLPGVGENLQEHVHAAISFELRADTPDDTWDLLRDPNAAAEHIELYKQGKGLFALGVTHFAFQPLDAFTSRAKAIYQRTEEKISKNEKAGVYPPGLIDQYRIQLERLHTGAPGYELVCVPAFMSAPNPPEPGKKYFSIAAGLNHAFSRGSVHSISADPNVQPTLDPRYFEEAIDLEAFAEMIKFIRRMPEVSPCKDILASSAKEVNPGPEVQTDEQIQDWLKNVTNTTYHTVGTLSMLPRSKNGVVDPSLKVYGTTNVRVVDLSIVPIHFAAHSQATAYVVAEKAADIIKSSHKV
ncbi:alcohol oxidase [Phlegmacium glaucopus]|nr:alcohol oxidase [Phlegmacium glaucopus]